MKALRIILASIKKADIDFNLFKENSRICIGISGGKDSMALFYALNIYKLYSKVNFEVIPMMIDLGFPNTKLDEIKEYFNELGTPLYIEDAKSVYQILNIQKEKQHLDHLPCSICSKMKKAIINKVAKKLNCDYVSFGHHKNDAIETLFLNAIYGGRIATFSPKMFFSRDKLTFIRPFIYIDESIITRLIKEENIKIFKSTCPNDKKTERENIKTLIKDINKIYPSSKDNFLTMLNNKEKLDVFFNHFEHKIERNEKYYYKIIEDSSSIIDEYKFLNKKLYLDKNLTHIHVYKDNKFFGVILYLKKDKEFTIKLIKLKDYSDIDYILYDLYNEIYKKYNPITFRLRLTKVIEKHLKAFTLNKKEKLGNSYLVLIDENPAKISKRLKSINSK